MFVTQNSFIVNLHWQKYIAYSEIDKSIISSFCLEFVNTITLKVTGLFIYNTLELLV